MTSKRANRILNATKSKPIKMPEATPLGSPGYDNARDDIEKTKSLREGSIEKVPVNDNDIANKKYLDDNYATIADDVWLKNNGDTGTGDYGFDGAVTINESGADKDFRVEGTGQANALFVDGSNGRVGIGTNAPGVMFDIQSEHAANLNALKVWDNPGGANLMASRARNTIAVPQIVQDGDFIGAFQFRAYDGTGYGNHASFGGKVDGTPVGFDNIPVSIFFSAGTGRDPAVVMRITSSREMWMEWDNEPIVLGAGKDTKTYYDGTDLIIDPNVVGTGKVLIGATGNDTIKAKYESSDGSTGQTGTYNFGGGGSGDIATMTFKDGILTATTTVP